MATKHDDGGPAFAHNEKSHDGAHYQTHPGMSLRDWFAGQALMGMLANGEPTIQLPTGFSTAQCAYEYADAMLRARAKGE